MTTNLDRWKKLYARVLALGGGGRYVKVGILAGKGAELTEDDGITLLELAFIHEFGSANGHVPERSFLRATFRTKRELINKFIERLAKTFLLGTLEIDKALGMLGAFVAAEVRKTITSRQTEGPGPQENAPATIAAKGSSVPLVDESRLISSISWSVES